MPDPLPNLGKYQIIHEIGRGGMGAVYKAYDPLLDRTVAIKLLAPHLIWEQGFVERFVREARAVARLDHPNIIHVHDVGQDENNYYFVMAYLPGPSLKQHIAHKGRLAPAEVLPILHQLADALDYAHNKGLIHRDVKPANVMFNERGQAVLTDFGIVKAAQESKLTATGTSIGTPHYMAPEQIRGQGVSASSDQYALGIITFEMLTGRVPFDADTTTAILFMQVNDPPPSLRKLCPDLPPAAEAALNRVLAKSPSGRYGTCGEFARALEQALSQPQPSTSTDRIHPYSGKLATETQRQARLTSHPVTPPPIQAMPQPTHPTTGRKTNHSLAWLLAGIGLVAVALLVLAIVAILGTLSKPKGTTGLPESWDARDIAISGEYAYVANGSYGLSILNITNPAQLVQTSSYTTSGNIQGVSVAGDYVYIAAGESGLHILDADKLAIVARYATSGSAQNVNVTGNYAYVADGDDGLSIIDISDPTNPSGVGSYNTGGFAWNVAVAGNYAYIADGYQGLRIISLANPTSPSQVGTYDTPGRAMDVAISGSYAYVADGDNGLQIINIANPKSPAAVSNLDTPGEARSVTIAGNYVYIADGPGGLRIVNVSNPAKPTEAGFFDTPGEAWSVAVIGEYAYVADGESGVNIVNVAGLR